ncbi:hypothetical protein [Rhodoblastus sp.]|uniref:hypothetical protein n=1 Tax=Rhodoblastus sp. TaxID=1962975 RepID=UPI0035AEB798
MRLYECDKCKTVNRINEFRLDKQPVCGACGQAIIDFPFCRIVRRIWNDRAIAVFFLMVVGFGFGMALTRSASPDASQGSTQAAIVPVPAPRPAAVAPQPNLSTASSAPQPATQPPEPVYQANGILRSDRSTGVAPLSVTAPRGNGGVYVKLLDYPSEHTRLAFFVNAGSRFETKVPLGKYKIVFATGDRWLGKPKDDKLGLFWPETNRMQLDSIFSFSSQEDGTRVEYTGHDIELIDQRDGNLRKKEISSNEFGD